MQHSSVLFLLQTYEWYYSACGTCALLGIVGNINARGDLPCGIKDPSMIKLTAFYSNSYYCSLAANLSLSLNKHWSGPYEISKVQGLESWGAAVSHKPKFILDSLVSGSCEGILYTDADSTLQRVPPIEQLTGDIAYTPFKRSPHHAEEALTGTMYFKNTHEVQAFVREWMDCTPQWKGMDTPEQLSLQQCLARTSLHIQCLGPEWTFIHDDMREIYPDAKEIFLHHQASRTYRELERQGKTQEMPDVPWEGVSERQVADPSEWSRSKGRAK